MRLLLPAALLLITTIVSPAGASDTLSPAALEDVNPDPWIVEAYIEASETDVELIPGVLTRMLAFNGSVPGPTIELYVGQRLVVHFTNNLPFPMTIHWHGVHVPANMDGSNISQTAVPPRPWTAPHLLQSRRQYRIRTRS